MSRPSIKTSLIAIFAGIALLFTTFAWLSVNALTEVNAKAEELGVNWLPSVKAVKDIQAETFALRIAYLNHITSTTPAALELADKAVVDVLGHLQQAMKVYEPLTSSDRERVLLGEFSTGLAAYTKAGEPMLELSRLNKNDEAVAELDKMRALIQQPLKILDELVNINVEGSKASVAASEATFTAAMLQTYVLIAIAGLIVLGASVFAMGSVAKPIQKITDSMKNLAGGDTDKVIPFAGRHDEIGAMAGAVEVFRQAAIENARLSADAEFQRKSNEEQRVILQQRAEEEARRKLLEATSALAAGLKKLASGDLTSKINEPVSEDFEGLRDDFNAAVVQLNETLSSVAHATGAIDSGTREISDGANDLSKRTE